MRSIFILNQRKRGSKKGGDDDFRFMGETFSGLEELKESNQVAE